MTTPKATAGTATALRLEARAMDKPDETKNAPHCKVEITRLQGKTFTRFTFLPGFRWSKDMGPIMGVDRCPGTHFSYQVSGRLGVQMRDGAEMVLEPGQAQVIPPGHEVWVIGNEPFVGITID
ncbi:MAG: cupin domain-containing protein [bacterium]